MALYRRRRMQPVKPTGVGLVDSPNEILAAIAPQIHEMVRVEAARVGTASAKKGETAATQAVWKAAIIAAIGGGILGGLIGYAVSRR